MAKLQSKEYKVRNIVYVAAADDSCGIETSCSR